jgi:general secretion pathway protein L
MKPFAEPLVDALRWWLRALASIFARGPEPFAPGAIRLRPSNGGFSVIGPDGAVLHHLATAAPSTGALEAIRRARRRYLDLDDETVLSVKATLPAAARGDLRDAIALRMAELTPFSEDEVLFDLGMPSRHGPDTVSVRAFVVPRDAVATAVDELVRLGIPIDGIIASETEEVTGTGAPDFAPEIPRRRAARRGLAFALACMFLASSTAWLHWTVVERQQHIRDTLRTAVAASLDKVRRANALDTEIVGLTASLSSPFARRADQVSPLELLDGISEILPDDAYLTGFRWSDGQVVMTGMAGDASALIRILEASPLLSEVRFSAPVARDARLNRDRFSVTARAGLPGARP